MNKTETKTVYAYSTDGKYVGERTLDYTDRSPISGAWQIPANMTETAPPETQEGYDLYFTNGTWTQVEIPVEEEPTQPEVTEDTEPEPYENPVETLQAQVTELQAQNIELQIAVAELTETLVTQVDTTQQAIAEMFETFAISE